MFVRCVFTSHSEVGAFLLSLWLYESLLLGGKRMLLESLTHFTKVSYTSKAICALHTVFGSLIEVSGAKIYNIKKLHLISENLYDTRSKTIFHRQSQTQSSLLYFYNLRQFNTLNVRNSFHTSLKIQLEISTLSFVTFLFLLPKLKTFG